MAANGHGWSYVTDARSVFTASHAVHLGLHALGTPCAFTPIDLMMASGFDTQDSLRIRALSACPVWGFPLAVITPYPMYKPLARGFRKYLKVASLSGVCYETPIRVIESASGDLHEHGVNAGYSCIMLTFVICKVPDS